MQVDYSEACSQCGQKPHNSFERHFIVKCSLPTSFSHHLLKLCLELAIPIKMSTSNPIQKSVVLESSVKPSLGCQKVQEPLTWGTVQTCSDAKV